LRLAFLLSGYRVEDYVMEKIQSDKKRHQRQSNMESLGQGMIDAGTEFGSTTGYGTYISLNASFYFRQKP
jgi:hypothetical protein